MKSTTRLISGIAIVRLAMAAGNITFPHGNATMNGTNPIDYPLPMPPPDLPACTENYATIEDLDAAADTIPVNCKACYLLSTLSNVFNAVMANYTELMADGYDGKFDTYSHAVADSAGKTVWDWVNAHGPDYFSCTVAEATVCCDRCENDGDPNACKYCWDDGDCYTYDHNKRDLDSTSHSLAEREGGGAGGPGGMGGSSSIRVFRYTNESEPCPPDFSGRGYGPTNPYDQSVYWTLNADRTDPFYADLFENTGIPKDKITLGNYNRGNNCAPSADMGDGDDCWASGYDYGIPMPTDYEAEDVANPKSVVEKALNNSNNLIGQLEAAKFALQMNAYGGDSFELVDSVTLPVLMAAEAIESMAQVEDIAEEIDEEKEKAMIMGFITAILFFVPIAGEVIGSIAELAEIGAMITVLGEAGNIAFDVYSMVDDPANAPLAILSLILEPLALADVAKVSKAANIRRGMADADVAKLGERVAGRMGTIKKITGTCVKRE